MDVVPNTRAQLVAALHRVGGLWSLPRGHSSHANVFAGGAVFLLLAACASAATDPLSGETGLVDAGPETSGPPSCQPPVSLARTRDGAHAVRWPLDGGPIEIVVDESVAELLPHVEAAVAAFLDAPGSALSRRGPTVGHAILQPPPPRSIQVVSGRTSQWPATTGVSFDDATGEIYSAVVGVDPRAQADVLPRLIARGIERALGFDQPTNPSTPSLLGRYTKPEDLPEGPTEADLRAFEAVYSGACAK